MKNINKNIAIIGAGAAGLMAAATLLEANQSYTIHIFEKNNKLGAKVIISGGGRCNVTTGVRDPHKLLKHYTRGAQFLKAALSKCNPEMVYNWFEERGVPLKMEDDLRAFPVSNDGNDIVGIFEKIFNTYNAHVHFQEPVQHISHEDNLFTLTTNQNTYTFDDVIITTGGNAYRQTGSTGDGYAFAQDLGHTITQLGPSLNSFVANEQWIPNLSGISFVNAELSVGKTKVHGPFLFTHFGISGPVTFSLSSHTSYETITKDNPLTITFKPDATKSFADWDKILQNEFQQNPQKYIKNVLNTFFPERFTKAILLLTHIKEAQKSGEIKKQKRQKIAHLLSGAMTITLIKRRPGDEFVTAGGVCTDEINPQTMESRICPHLYFAGEVMNVDGVTGGFNLQSSWATGQLAAKSIIRKYKKGI